MPALTAEQVTIIRAGLDASAYEVGAGIVVAANQKMAASGEPVTQTTTKMTGAMASTAAQFERYALRAEDNYRAIERFAQIQEVASRYVEQNASALGQANAMLAIYRDRLGLVYQANEALNGSLEKGRAQYDSLFAVSKQYAADLANIQKLSLAGGFGPIGSEAAIAQTQKAMEALNKAYSDQTGTAKALADANQEEINKTKALATERERLTQQFAPLTTANNQYAETLRGINRAVDLNVIGEKEAITLRGKAGASHEELTAKIKAGTAGLNAMEHGSAGVTRELLVMTHEAIQGRFSNMAGSFLVLSERVAFLRDGIANLAIAAFNPLGIAVIGGTLLLGGLALSAEFAAERMGKLRNELLLSRTDAAGAAEEAEKAAKTLARITALTSTQARAFVQPVYESVNFGGGVADAVELVRTFERLNLAVGVAADDTKILKGFLTDAAAEAQKLFDEHPNANGLTQQLITNAKHLEETGQRAAAMKLIFDAIAKSVQGVDEHVTPLTRALHDLTEAFTATDASGNGFAKTIGGPLITEIAHFVRDITGMAQSIQDLIDKMGILDGKRATSVYVPGAGNVPLNWPGTGGGGSMTTNPNLSPAQRALLDTIAGPESAGQYNVRYGGPSGSQTFDSFARHPMIPEVTANGRTSDAAGRYQFLSSTYQPIAQRLGLPDFSPASQDRAAWDNAVTAYAQRNPGRDLEADVLAGNVAAISGGLNGQWPSMPGGSQQQLSQDQFQQRLRQNLAAQSNAPTITVPMPVANPSDTLSGPRSMGLNVRGEMVPGGTTLPGASGSTAGMFVGNAAQDEIKAEKDRQALGMTLDARAKLTREMEKYQAVSERMARNGDAEGAEKYAKAVEHVRGLLEETRTAQEQSIKADKEKLEISAASTASEGQLIAIRIQQRNLAAAHPDTDIAGLAAQAENNFIKERLNLLAQGANIIQTHTDQTEQLTRAWAVNGKEVAIVTAHNTAYNEVIKLIPQSSAAFQGAVDSLTVSLLKQGQAEADTAAAHKSAENRQALDYIKAESATLLETSETRTRILAAIKEQQRIELDPKLVTASEEKKRQLVAEAVAIADATQQLQRQQQVLNEVGNLATQAFDQVGAAITNAFINGNGAAVNFGNVFRGIITSILQEVAKLAIINPIINSLGLGPHRSTLGELISIGGGAAGTIGGFFGGGGSGDGSGTGGLGAVAGAVGIAAGVYGGSGGSGGSGGAVDIAKQLYGGASNLYSVGSLGDKLGLSNLGNYVTQGTDYIGLTGQGGVFPNGLGASSIWNTPVYNNGAFVLGSAEAPTSVLTAAQEAALVSSAGEIPAGTAAAANVATVGSIAGSAGTIGAGIGIGYGLGSFIGSYEPNPQNAQYGAAGGAVAGAGAGAVAGTVIFPGVGTVIGAALGGIIGGVGGGVGGGFIGPGPANAYVSTPISIQGGQLAGSATLGQGYDVGAFEKGTQTDIQTLNRLLSSGGFQLVSTGGVSQIGGPSGDPSKVRDLTTALPGFRFGSNSNEVLNRNVEGQSFASIQALQQIVADVTLLLTNRPALMEFGVKQGSIAGQIGAIENAFNPVIAAAHRLGEAEDQLTQRRDDAIKAAVTLAEKTLQQTLANARVSGMTAQAALTGDRGMAHDAQLMAFDNQAQVQREALDKAMTDIYGDSVRTNAGYIGNMAALEDSLGKQRLLIAKQYSDQLLALQAQILAADLALTVRGANASATLSGQPQDAATARFLAFDVGAAQQRTAFSAQLIAANGDATTSTADYAAQMSLLNGVLALERQTITKTIDQQVAANLGGLAANDNALRLRGMTATNGNTAATQLFAFDIGAQQQTAALSAQLTGWFGPAYAQTQEFADHMTLLERTLAAERLRVVQQNTSAISAATQVTPASITALTAYIDKLKLSPASPLSPQSQLTLASSQFNAVSGAAAAGNFNSATQLPGYSDALLAASRVVNGSGAAYAADFQRVLDAFDRIGANSADTLTASVLQTEVRTQTQQITDELGKLRAAVNGITLQLQQNATMPARVA